MAARKHQSHDERTRAKIQTSQLVNRLECFAFGVPAPAAAALSDDAPPVVLDAGQLRAIEILLRKTLPDLAAITISGDEQNPLHVMQSPSDKLIALLDAKASDANGS